MLSNLSTTKCPQSQANWIYTLMVIHIFHQPQGDTKTRADKLHHSLRMVVTDYSAR